MPTNRISAYFDATEQDAIERSDSLEPLSPNEITTADIYRAANLKAERDRDYVAEVQAIGDARSIDCGHSDDAEQAAELRGWHRGYRACKWDGRIRWFAWGFLTCALLVVLRRYFS